MRGLIGIGLSIVVASSLTACATVSSGEVGVKTNWGVVDSQPLNPGVHLYIPFIQGVNVLSVRTVPLPEEFATLTSDGQSLKITATATYSINGLKAPDIYKTIGRDEESVKNTVIVPVLLGVVKDVISKHDMFYIIENQTTVAQEIAAGVAERLKTKDFINFQAIVITGFVPDPQVQQAIEQKQIAKQKLEQKQTEVAIAQKEAERLKALQTALTPENILNRAVEKWDGTGIPPTVGSNIQLLIQQAKKN